jgi:hypothetical protein
MKDLRQFDHARLRGPLVARFFGGTEGGRAFGAFQFGPIRIIATTDGGWDHVSVSREDRCPTWDEMEAVKRRFFLPHETAMQLHVPEAEHINCHPFCLHLWRPHARAIPLPPSSMVGPKVAA